MDNTLNPVDPAEEKSAQRAQKAANRKRKAAAKKRKAAVSRTSTSEKQRAAQAQAAQSPKKSASAKKRKASQNKKKRPAGAQARTPAQQRARNAQRSGRPTAAQQKNARRSTAMQQQQRKRRRKKKYKINYRKFVTSLVALALVILLVVLVFRGIANSTRKNGWYYAYVKAASSDVKIGVATKLNKNGQPTAADPVEEVEEGVYAIPVQRGGTTAIIVADENYSFNRVNSDDPNYYLAELTCLNSSSESRQAKFVEKHQPSVVSTGAKKIATESTEELPNITLYKNKRATKELATVGVGTAQPSASYKDLDFVSRKKPETPEREAETSTFTFTASGDNLIHENIYEQASTRAMGKGYDFDAVYADVSDFYQQHDLNWINQESLVSDDLTPSSSPNFCSPGEVAESVYNMMKVRVFNVSNNHIYDQGAEGVNSTMNFYNKKMPADTLASGLYKKSNLYDLPIYTCNGRAVAFLAYTLSTNGYTTPDDAKYTVIYNDETDVIKKQVKQAKEEADVVIVSCHWGTEDSHTITDDQKELAQSIANWGADLIIGTNPHVIQDAEWLSAKDGRDVFCAYSLGNFISTQSSPDELIGLVFECTISTTIDAKGVSNVSIEKPLLYPVITMYGEEATNVHAVWFSDFTDEMAEEHGVAVQYPTFTKSYITYVLQKYVNDEFLVLSVGATEEEEDEDTDTDTETTTAADSSAVTTTAGNTLSQTTASTETTTVFVRSTTAASTTAPSTTASSTEEDTDEAA